MRKRLWDAVCIFLFAWLVAGLVYAVAVAQEAQPPAHAQSADKPRAEKLPECDERSFWQRSACDPVAAYTGVLALFTGILIVISVIQIRFLTRADENARRSAEAAEKAATTAEKALLDGERPWLFTQEVIVKNRNIGSELYIPNNFWFSVRLKNVGRSPAFPQRCVIKFGDAETLPDKPDYSGGANIGLRTTMAVGDDQETNPVGPTAHPLKDGEATPQKIAFGVVTYTDVNGRSHRTGFAYMIAPVGAMAVAWNNSNYEYYE